MAAALALYAVPTVPLGNEDGKVRVGAVMVMDKLDEVVLRGVGVPESVTLNVRLEYVPAQEAVGAWPEVVVITPMDLRVRQAGNVVPVPNVQV